MQQFVKTDFLYRTTLIDPRKKQELVVYMEETLKRVVHPAVHSAFVSTVLAGGRGEILEFVNTIFVEIVVKETKTATVKGC